MSILVSGPSSSGGAGDSAGLGWAGFYSDALEGQCPAALESMGRQAGRLGTCRTSGRRLGKVTGPRWSWRTPNLTCLSLHLSRFW